LAVLLTRSASASLREAAERKGESVARAVALRVEDWVSERRQSLAVIANAAAGDLRSPQTRAELVKIDKISGDFSLIEITDMTGRVLATSRSGTAIDAAGQAWFRTAAAGRPTLTSPTRVGDRIRWIAAHPILGGNGRPQGVVVGDLNPGCWPS